MVFAKKKTTTAVKIEEKKEPKIPQIDPEEIKRQEEEKRNKAETRRKEKEERDRKRKELEEKEKEKEVNNTESLLNAVIDQMNSLKATYEAQITDLKAQIGIIKGNTPTMKDLVQLLSQQKQDQPLLEDKTTFTLQFISPMKVIQYIKQKHHILVPNGELNTIENIKQHIPKHLYSQCEDDMKLLVRLLKDGTNFARFNEIQQEINLKGE